LLRGERILITTPDDQTVSGEELPAPGPTHPTPSHHRGSVFRRLLRGTFHYGLGQTLPQLLRFLLLPIYLQFLGPADLGQLDLAAQLSMTLLIVMRLGVPGAVTRFYFEHHEGPDLRDYVTTIAIFLLLSSFALGGAMLIVGPWLFQWLIPGLPFYPIGLLVIGLAMISCNQNLQDRLVQAREQASYAALLNVGRAALSILLAVIFVAVLRWGVFGMMLGELIGSALFFIQAGIYLRPELTGRFRMDLLRSSFTYGLGILPGQLIDTGTPLATRSYLAHVGSLASVGQLGIASRFTQPLSVLNTAFNTSFSPVYFAVRKQQTDESLAVLARVARNIWTVAVAFALAAALVAPPVIRLIKDEEYHTAAEIVPILCIAFLGQALTAITAPEVFYSKRTYFVSLQGLLASAVTIVVMMALTRTYGAKGIAWAITAGTLTSSCCFVILAVRSVSIPHQLRDFCRALICGLAVLLISWAIPAYNAWYTLLFNSLCLPLLPLFLWISGDPAIRDGWEKARAVLPAR
jgi:O-antigen/teichoic acid export membrane protein